MSDSGNHLSFFFHFLFSFLFAAHHFSLSFISAAKADQQEALRLSEYEKMTHCLCNMLKPLIHSEKEGGVGWSFGCSLFLSQQFQPIRQAEIRSFADSQECVWQRAATFLGLWGSCKSRGSAALSYLAPWVSMLMQSAGLRRLLKKLPVDQDADCEGFYHFCCHF